MDAFDEDATHSQPNKLRYTGVEPMEIDESAANNPVDMKVAASDATHDHDTAEIVPIEGKRQDVRAIGTSGTVSANAMGTNNLYEDALIPSRSSGYQPRLDSLPPRVELNSQQSNAIGVRPRRFPGGDQLVFNGGSTREHSLSQLTPRLIMDNATRASIDNVPLLTNGDSFDNEITEPDPKRPRLDEYEIALAASDEPQNYAEPMASPEMNHWKEAIRAEISAHVKNHTWDVVHRPPGVKVIGFKWVFAHKFEENGEIVRYKARLVALGYLQTHGVDYRQTYSSGASSNTIRVFLAVCCSMQLVLRQFDIETAFLNGDLEEVYMAPPLGIRIAAGMVCNYDGVSAVWFKKIRSVFLSMGLEQCRADPCMFVRNGGANDDLPVFIVLNVDELLVGCKSDAVADAIRDELAAHFTVKSLGAA
ncbi:Polyprotein [Phytophthora palmivora]|uniref:Polyprotein n=1 Tax=Phytophthora palmivora TaxID=4796 RepID=A0A2P4YUV0_9STRA|nr:Polyprotein [Phytophthora palmivora]